MLVVCDRMCEKWWQVITKVDNVNSFCGLKELQWCHNKPTCGDLNNNWLTTASESSIKLIESDEGSCWPNPIRNVLTFQRQVIVHFHWALQAIQLVCVQHTVSNPRSSASLSQANMQSINHWMFTSQFLFPLSTCSVGNWNEKTIFC